MTFVVFFVSVIIITLVFFFISVLTPFLRFNFEFSYLAPSPICVPCDTRPLHALYPGGGSLALVGWPWLDLPVSSLSLLSTGREIVCPP